MDPNNSKGRSESFDVTGVSRSGRVRKKSSKLMDFESSDEMDNKYKRKSQIDVSPKEKIRKIGMPKQRIGRNDDDGEYRQPHSHMYNDPEPMRGSDSEIDYHPEEEDDQFEMDDEEEEDDDDDDDYTEGQLVVDEKAPNQSLYMSEKSKKKVVVKDGRVMLTAKTQRKDKGKSRFTAYMMWSKEVRQELSKQYPDMDFTTMARRLSELWATVPNSERETWRKKAKREGLKKPKTKSDAPLMPSRKFINKKGGPIAPLQSVPIVQTPRPPAVVVELSPTKSMLKKPAELIPPPATGKISGIAPIDVAAHLKLLGESLSIIGERLKEHEGQIAVSGSLSVLLDSLLCAMGPLLCLTQQVPEMQMNQDVLTKILHNTAYMMPGLG